MSDCLEILGRVCVSTERICWARLTGPHDGLRPSNGRRVIQVRSARRDDQVEIAILLEYTRSFGGITTCAVPQSYTPSHGRIRAGPWHSKSE